MKRLAMAEGMLCLLSACSTFQNEPAHVAYGKLLAVQPRLVTEQKANLTGALVGGVTGGVVGNQIGKGNGRKAATVLGVIAGAAVGSQVGTQQTTKQVSDLQIEMADGQIFAVTTDNVGFQAGQSVRIVQQGRTASIEAITSNEGK